MSLFSWVRIGVASLVQIVAILVASTACAADNKVETVITGLRHPCGIAVRPNGTADKYELFIAESAAGCVIRWSNHDRNKTADAITGFAATSGRNAGQQTGPQALLFLDPGLIAVGSATKSGDPLRIYELPEDGKAISADQSNADGRGESRRTRQTDEQATCTSLTRIRANDTVQDAIVMFVRGFDGGSSLVRSRVQAGVIGPPQPFGTMVLSRNAESSEAVATSNSWWLVSIG
jgi:hypothetical protein